MATAVRASWAPLHPQPYRHGPTPASVELAGKLNRPLDIDVRVTRDGRLAGAHNRIPGQEGFRYTKASVRHGVPRWKVGRLVGKPISDLHSNVVWSLRHKDRTRIWPVGHLVDVAGEHDAPLEFEPKVRLTRDQLANLRTACIRAFGEDRWRKRTWLKKLIRVFGVPVPWRTLLRDARELQFRTIALRAGSDAYGRTLPVTFYRL